MPELEALGYSRDATVLAFRDYYQFIVDIYLDDVEIIEPPEEGWPSFSPEFQQLFGKSDAVIDLLRYLPYIRSEVPGGKWYPCHGSPDCYWADWQFLAQDVLGEDEKTTGISTTTVKENFNALTEGSLSDIPAHVVGLTFGGREHTVLLLDTVLGVIHVSGILESLESVLSYLDPLVYRCRYFRNTTKPCLYSGLSLTEVVIIGTTVTTTPILSILSTILSISFLRMK